MRQTQAGRRDKIFISLLIVLVIVLHALPVLFQRGPRQTLWPFLTWGMYKNARAPGPIEARKTRLIGVGANGTTEELTWQLIGLPRATVRELFIKGMRSSDPAVAQQLFQRLNATRAEPLTEIRIESKIYGLSDSGVVMRENSVVTFRADSSHLN